MDTVSNFIQGFSSSLIIENKAETYEVMRGCSERAAE